MSLAFRPGPKGRKSLHNFRGLKASAPSEKPSSFLADSFAGLAYLVTGQSSGVTVTVAQPMA